MGLGSSESSSSPRLMLGMMIDLFLGQPKRRVAAIGKVNKLYERNSHVLGDWVGLGTLVGRM